MTDEQIHNIYLHMSGKAEGLAEAQGHADFPVLFARAILEYDRMEREHPLPLIQKSITTLELSTRAKNCLVAEGIETIGQLINELKNSRNYLGKIHNCGKITEKEIKRCLKKSGFTWGEHDLFPL